MAETTPPSGTSSVPPVRVGVWRRLSRLEFREAWWAFLDQWETRRAFRWWTGGLVLGLALVLAIWLGAYPWWMRRNAVQMARQWLDAGQPGYAAEVIRRALDAEPDRPELWSMAAELARRAGQVSMEVQYRRRAFDLAPHNRELALDWTSALLRAGQTDEAEAALAGLPAADLDKSAFAQRLLGEAARRHNQLKEAIARFETALRLDGGGGADELPLGLCLLASADENDRRRGRGLLVKLTADPGWSAAAQRTLLLEAVRRNDPEAMVRWAEALRANPRCTVGDIPECLGALLRGAPAKYAAEVARLKKTHLATPQAAAELVGWLNTIGRWDEALAWLDTLPQDAVRRPPLAVSKAEALRGAGRWSDLRDWTEAGDWGRDLEFLRCTYGLCAAHALGDTALEAKLHDQLVQRVRADSPHALFAGSSLYAWGMAREAEELWWLAAGAGDNISIEALGSLARFYQVRRDADGQYRAFNQLHALRPNDDSVSNNFCFFAALTGNREQLTASLAKSNATRHPADKLYQATYAFVLFMHGKSAEALATLAPWKAEADKSAAITLVYGLALAGTGDKATARPLLHRLDPEQLTLREVALIKATLGD